jgi:hypothetical protein
MSKGNINFGRTKFKAIYHCIAFSLCMLIGGTIAAFVPGEIAEKVGGISQAGLFVYEGILRLVFAIGYSYYYIHINHRFTMSEFRIKKPITILIALPAAIIIPALVTGFFIVFIPGELTFTDVSPYLLFTILIGTILTNGIILALFDEIWLRCGVLHFLEIGFGRKLAVVFLTLSVGLFTILGFV